MGIGDWGLGIGDWAQSPIPNPQSPIPNPQSPIPILIYRYLYNLNKFNFLLYIKITKYIKYLFISYYSEINNNYSIRQNIYI